MFVFLGSLIISSVLSPILIRYANSLRLIDEPDGQRKYQETSIPVIGGIVIFSCISIISILGLGLSKVISLDNSYVYMWAVPCIFVFLVGLYDDISNLSPAAKLGGQLIAALLASGSAYFLNLKSEVSSNPYLNFLVTLSWIIFVTNALNFLDNHDGVATSYSILVFVFFSIVSLLTDQNLIFILSMIHIGALFGFLKFNFPNARAYLGDAGSLFLGTSIATIALRIDTSAATPLLSVIAILMLFSTLIADTFLAILSRLRARRAVYLGGRDHIAHRLQVLGFNKLATLLIMVIGFVISLIFSVIVNFSSGIIATVAVFVYFIAYFLIVLMLSRVIINYD